MIRIAIFIVVLLAALPARAEDPDILWKLISLRCVPGELQHGDPKPCVAVDLSQGVAHGYVLLKDRTGVAQVLTMPTARITGMEDPAILAPDAANYFAPAWRALSVASASLGHPIPRNLAALAINSVSGRSQNQLHIHTDCMDADIRAQLSAEETMIGPSFAPLPHRLHGDPYRAMRIAGENLDDINPIRLLAADPAAAAEMGHHTLVVVGTTLEDGKPGFIILDDRAGAVPGDRGSGEELLDHGCHGA